MTPQNYYHCWMVDQIAVTSLKIEHLNRVERRERDRFVLRSKLFWDDDRRLAAEVLGERLAGAPAQVANQLRRTPQGCDWMIDRWAGLARIVEAGGPWDQARRSLAFDLLGARPDQRDGFLGEVVDQEGRVVSAPIEPAELARREVAALRERKQEVAGLDVLDRALAEADYVDQPTPEIRQLHRRNAELHRRLKWYVSQIQAKPTYPRTKPGVYDYFKPDSDFAPAPPPEPEIPATAPEPGPVVAIEPEPGVEIEVEPGSDPEAKSETDIRPRIFASRQDDKSRKAEARREAKRRKLDRRRA